MGLTLAGTGLASGAAAGLAIHLLFCLVRRYAPTAAAVIGWIISTITILCILFLIRVYLQMRSDPMASTAGLWAALAAMLFIALLTCGVVGLVHRWALTMRWSRATGILVAEVSTAILAGYILNAFLYSIADIIRGGDRDIPRILASFAQARNLLGAFDMALAVSLLFLEISVPLVYLWRRRRQRSLEVGI